MKVRIISALVGIVVLAGVLLCPYTWVFAVAAALLAALAVWELLHNTGIAKPLAFTIPAMVFAALGVICMFRTWLYKPDLYAGIVPGDWYTQVLPFLPAAFAVVALIAWVFCHKKISFNDACAGYLLTFYATVGFGSLAALRSLDSGRFSGLWYVLHVLVVAWMSDTGAYFTGYFIGKHKMAPVISPKKTWEGFFGGWIISAVFSGLLGLAFNYVVGVGNVWWSMKTFALLGLVLAPLSVLGDLLASWIKRRTGIKDYGSIMPGHGGVMDRFDSVILVAPVLYLLLFITT